MDTYRKLPSGNQYPRVKMIGLQQLKASSIILNTTAAI